MRAEVKIRKKEGMMRRGQMTVEYTVMFVAIIAAIIYAATNVVRPSVNRFFDTTGNVIDKATDEVSNSINRL